MQDDQEHLSAQYMQHKAVGLLARCGDLTAKLQIMSRLRDSLLNLEDFRRITQDLCEGGEGLTENITRLKTEMQLKLKSKLDPSAIRSELDLFAPSQTLGNVEQSVREMKHLYDAHMAHLQRELQKQYEQAMRDAGLLATGMADDLAASAASQNARAMSLVDHLSGGEGASDEDELAAMKAVLAMLENSAPASWRLKDRMDQMHNETSVGDVIMAELSAKLKHLQQRYDALAQQKAWLAAEIGDVDPKTGQVLTPAQAMRKQVDALRAMILGTQALSPRSSTDLRSMPKERLLSRVQNANDTAKKLHSEFSRNEKKLNELCKQHGIDLEQIMMDCEEESGSDVSEDDKFDEGEENNADGLTAKQRAEERRRRKKEQKKANSAVFKVGGTTTTKFRVKFAMDGTQRLMAVGRAAAATDKQPHLDWLHSSIAQETNAIELAPAHEIPTPQFSSHEDRYVWCRDQLIKIEARIHDRFKLLRQKTYELADDSQKQHRDFWDNNVLALERGSSSLREGLHRDSNQIRAFRHDVQARLQEIAKQNRMFDKKAQYFQQIHRDSLVLLQRMGEEVDEIIV